MQRHAIVSDLMQVIGIENKMILREQQLLGFMRRSVVTSICKYQDILTASMQKRPKNIIDYIDRVMSLKDKENFRKTLKGRGVLIQMSLVGRVSPNEDRSLAPLPCIKESSRTKQMGEEAHSRTWHFWLF